MTRGRTGTAQRFRSAVLLLIAVVLLRALVPTGYMPGRASAGEGGFEFVICHGGEADPAAPDRSEGCDFALLAAAWLPVAILQLPAAPTGGAVPSVRVGEASHAERTRIGGGGARAPPTVS